MGNGKQIMTGGFTKNDKFHPIKDTPPRMSRKTEIDMMAKNNGEIITVSTSPNDNTVGIESLE